MRDTGCCPICGTPCAPYYACPTCREKKRLNRTKNINLPQHTLTKLQQVYYHKLLHCGIDKDEALKESLKLEE